MIDPCPVRTDKKLRRQARSIRRIMPRQHPLQILLCHAGLNALEERPKRTEPGIEQPRKKALHDVRRRNQKQQASHRSQHAPDARSALNGMNRQPDRAPHEDRANQRDDCHSFIQATPVSPQPILPPRTTQAITKQQPEMGRLGGSQLPDPRPFPSPKGRGRTRRCAWKIGDEAKTLFRLVIRAVPQRVRPRPQRGNRSVAQVASRRLPAGRAKRGKGNGVRAKATHSPRPNEPSRFRRDASVRCPCICNKTTVTGRFLLFDPESDLQPNHRPCLFSPAIFDLRPDLSHPRPISILRQRVVRGWRIPRDLSRRF